METTMEIKKIDRGFELTCDVVDREFYARIESTSRIGHVKWVLDEFDMSVSDNNSAYIESSDHSTLGDAIQEAFARCEDILNHHT